MLLLEPDVQPEGGLSGPGAREKLAVKMRIAKKLLLQLTNVRSSCPQTVAILAQVSAKDLGRLGVLERLGVGTQWRTSRWCSSSRT